MQDILTKMHECGKEGEVQHFMHDCGTVTHRYHVHGVQVGCLQ